MDKKTIQEQLENKRKMLTNCEWGEEGKRRLTKSIAKWERKLEGCDKAKKEGE
jgi:hypothetical protein